MRRWLRGVLEWMDKRWPERVVVTQAEYMKLRETVDRVDKLLKAERLEKIEAEINKFNVAMGFGGSVVPKGTTIPFQR